MVKKQEKWLTLRDVIAKQPKPIAFGRQVLGASLVYGDADFAVLRRDGAEWMLHADHTYSSHPLLALTGDGALRGAGVEIRLHDHDPDGAAVTAEKLGYTVLAGAADKPHGLREAYIADPDGYVWVLDRPLAG